MPNRGETIVGNGSITRFLRFGLASYEPLLGPEATRAMRMAACKNQVMLPWETIYVHTWR
jgi:hypothetical protein